MHKKWRLLPALVCVVMLFSSCSLISYQNAGDLLHAPRLGQGQGEIQNALAADLGEEPQYIFPKEGEWRSPLVMADLNGDGQQEGILFYVLSSSVGAGTEVNMAILENTEEGWKVAKKVPGLSTDVASVEVTSMFGDNSQQLIVGYFSTSLQSKMMALYRYVDADFTSKSLNAGSYSYYLLKDFTGTGRLDIALVSTQPAQGDGWWLDFISAQNDTFERVQKTVELYANFTSFKALHPTLGPGGERLLVVDGEVAGGMASQILNYSVNGEGFYPRPDTADMVLETFRTSSLLTSRDIDGDGMVEIPVDAEDDSAFAAVPEERSLRSVEWYNFFSAQPEFRQYGVLDLDRNIYVRLPDNWRDYYEVTISKAYEEWQVQDSRTGEVLMQLRPAEAGEIPPGEEKRVPDTANLYFFPASSVSFTEKNQIKVISLI